MANSNIELESLINTCGTEGHRLGLEFTSDKSAVILFNDDGIAQLEVQGIEVEQVDKYKYLGLWINEGTEYLNEHAKRLTG